MVESGLDFYLAPAPWATPLCYALRAARKGNTPLSAAKSAKGAVVEQLAEIMLQSIA